MHYELQDARREGRRAFMEGMNDLVNPHKDDELWDAWREGYYAARREHSDRNA